MTCLLSFTFVFEYCTVSVMGHLAVDTSLYNQELN